MKRLLFSLSLALSFTGLLRSETVGPASREGLRYDVYGNIPGKTVSSLEKSPDFPDNPVIANMLWTSDFCRKDGNFEALKHKTGLGERLSGYLIAPKTGNYVFWVAGRDTTALYLSTDTNPSKKIKIAWTDKANASSRSTRLPIWLSNGTVTGRSAANDFSFNGGAPGVISLTAGKLYYIELQHKAGTKGPGAQAVGWTLPGDTLQASAPTQIIPGKYLTPNVVAVPNLQLTNEQLASRFLSQATCGATPQDIASLAAALAANPDTAFADWLKAQYARQVSPNDLSLNLFRTTYPPHYPVSGYRQHTHDAEAIRASLMISDNNNELRRKIAYVLGQIFVVSDSGTELIGAPEGMCDWNDLLFRDSFADFSTILHDVTYHPVMAAYLSLQDNAKAGYYNKGSRPDENYAREVMQLFTIGLVKLNRDGTYVRDSRGRSIPTYNQSTITEMARVFTGLKYPTGMSEGRAKGKEGYKQWIAKVGNVRFGRDSISEKRHDTDAKTVFGTTLPAGRTTEQDIGDVLNILVNHPNTAPFLARALIQHMVTSNPGPAYVKRVADTFVGSHGDMKAVVSAVLLDPEARDPANALDDQYGKLREPWLRVTQLARGFSARPGDREPLFNVYDHNIRPKLGEYPFQASSVFNFFLPSYQSPGSVAERNADASDSSVLLVDPEFQIMNSNTSLLTPNYLMDIVYNNGADKKRKGPLQLDLSPQIRLAGSVPDLINNVDTLLTSGMMSDRTRQIISNAVSSLGPETDTAVLRQRAATAIYLTMISPDYAIQK